VACPQTGQSAEYALRPPGSLVHTANVTSWRHPGQPPDTWRHGSHQG
jgi:hypothetical protein